MAEHLDKKYAQTLINTLTKLSSLIIFTAATPGQGPRSIGHINEQIPEYWTKKFQEKNFIFQQKLTNEIKRKMKKENVVWWITKNLMIFKKIHC